jgi:hypothetical protein
VLPSGTRTSWFTTSTSYPIFTTSNASGVSPNGIIATWGAGGTVCFTGTGVSGSIGFVSRFYVSNDGFIENLWTYSANFSGSTTETKCSTTGAGSFEFSNDAVTVLETWAGSYSDPDDLPTPTL